MGGETVLVTDAGLGCAVSIIRSLGQAGYRVMAAGNRRGCAGMASRWADDSLTYPSPVDDPEGYVQRLDRAVDTHGIDVVFPVTDQAILPLMADRGRFERRCELAMADEAMWDLAADKERTRHDAKQLGIPSPCAVVVRTVEEAVDSVEAMDWPVVVKPRLASTYSRKHIDRISVTYAGNERELRSRVAELEGRCDILLQEYVSGRGMGVELLMLRGDPLMAFQHERLREFPVHGGPGALRRSMKLDPTLLKHAISLLSYWKWTGLAMVEFKCKEDDAWLIEVNGRVWGSMALSSFSGIDFPTSYIRMLLNGERPCADDSTYHADLRARDLDKDLMWILAVLSGQPRRRHPLLPTPGRREAMQAALQLAHPAIRCDIQSWRDPLPGLLDLGHTTGRLGRKVLRAVGRGRRKRGHGAAP